MVPRALTAVVFGLLGLAVSAASVGAEVRLSVNGGQVDLVARQATVREILDEWTKVAGTTFIGLGELPSDVVTLDLRGVSERQALEILLRTASGYIILPDATGAPIQSQFRSVLVLNGSVAHAQGDNLSARLARPLPAVAESQSVDIASGEVTGNDLSTDASVSGGDDTGFPPASQGGVTGRSARERPLPSQPNGLPPGVKPGEPIGDPFSRPGLIPAWQQDSLPALPSGRVVAPSGSATPGAIVSPQMRTPGADRSMSEPSPVPGAAATPPSQ